MVRTSQTHMYALAKYEDKEKLTGHKQHLKHHQLQISDCQIRPVTKQT